MPNNDHPVIPQNLYRMSGGASNNDRFEQIGQSWLQACFHGIDQEHLRPWLQRSRRHAPWLRLFGSLRCQSECRTQALGSRAWINPFTGAYPRNDSPTPNNSHTGHTHQGPSHRILVEMSDLNTIANPGATYFAEGQYVTPHEYAWCQSHAGQCNMYNNVSYRQLQCHWHDQSFHLFARRFATVRKTPAILAWTGATINQIEPAPGVDGIGFVGYKVTNPSAGVWHYEYAVYNQNLDRAIQSFSVPLGCGVTISNLGFHAPPQHPGWAADGTVGNAGYSSTPGLRTKPPLL